MTQMIVYPEENTIFTQAIDQNYENNKENLQDFSEDFESFLEFGDLKLKLNLDFIENQDECLINTKSQHKKSEGNFSNSCESSDSTDFDTFSVNPFQSENKLLTENKQNLKINNFLNTKFESDSSTSLTSEIKKCALTEMLQIHWRR